MKPLYTGLVVTIDTFFNFDLEEERDISIDLEISSSKE